MSTSSSTKLILLNPAYQTWPILVNRILTSVLILYFFTYQIQIIQGVLDYNSTFKIKNLKFKIGFKNMPKLVLAM